MLVGIVEQYELLLELLREIFSNHEPLDDSANRRYTVAAILLCYAHPEFMRLYAIEAELGLEGEEE